MLEISCNIALRETSSLKTDKKTGLFYSGWNELQAANVLGITHKALRAAIKKFSILEPLPDDGQGDLFGDASLTPEFISGELFAAQYGKTGVN